MPQNYLGIHGVVGFVVAVGERGKIIHFAGDLYEAMAVDSPTMAHLNAVWVVSERCAWAVGEQGAVLRWDGTVWATIAMGAKDDELFAVWSCHETDGRDSIWIGGRDTLMVHCTATGAQGTLMRTEPPFAVHAAELHGMFTIAQVLIGYNVGFDLDMLQAEFARAGLPPLDVDDKLIVDPYRLWGAMEPRGLRYAHRRFVGSDFDGAHKALADVAATAAVLCGMLTTFGLQPEWYSLAELCRGRRA